MARAILGVGNPLRRDDGVGPWVAERMRGTGWEVVVAGSRVENALGLVRRLAPDLLVVVDAAEMGLPRGASGGCPWRRRRGWSARPTGFPFPSSSER